MRGRFLEADLAERGIDTGHQGEFDTSTTTSAPARTAATPSPVKVSTPEAGEADTASMPTS